jgi:hypothetical protein
MTDVRLSCMSCGTIEVAVEDITVRCCDDVKEFAYRFRCPKCVKLAVTDISLDIAALLLRAGAPVEHWQLPLELFERPEHAAPIDHDDLIDFHAAIDRWTGFDNESRLS